MLRPDDGLGLRFAHALVRDAVYELLLKARRRELHRRAADWFADRDPVLQAEHLDRAEAPEAAAAYLAAAKAQLGDYRFESARTLLERGLAVARSPMDLLALSCLHGETLHDLGAIPEAMQSFARALELTADDAGRCQAWLGLAACKRMTDDLAGAEADLELARATATRLGLPDVLARAHYLAGNLCFPRGDIDGCLLHHRQSLAFAQACGSAQHEAAALGGLGDADYVRGRMVSAQRHFERCLELCRVHGLGRIAAAHRQMLGLTRFFCNDVRGALADALATAELARHIGQPRAEMVAHMIAAEMCANLMLLEDAMAHLEEVERLVAGLGAARFEPLRLNCLAKTLRAMGRRAEALPLLRRSVEASRETSLTFSGPSALGALALTTDDPASAARRSGRARASCAPARWRTTIFAFTATRSMRPCGPGTGARRSVSPRRWPGSRPPSRCHGPTSMRREAERWPPGVVGNVGSGHGLSSTGSPGRLRRRVSSLPCLPSARRWPARSRFQSPSSSALASIRSGVSKPSVNQP